MELTLISSDDIKFRVNDYFIKCCKTLSNMLEDVNDASDEPISIPYHSTHIQIIIDFAKMHEGLTNTPDENPNTSFHVYDGDINFINKVDTQTLFDGALLPPYLDYERMEIVWHKEMARRIEKMTTEEARLATGEVNDYTPEEEEKVRQENAFLKIF